jgi:hypothetical protein
MTRLSFAFAVVLWHDGAVQRPAQHHTHRRKTEMARKKSTMKKVGDTLRGAASSVANAIGMGGKKKSGKKKTARKTTKKKTAARSK